MWRKKIQKIIEKNPKTQNDFIILKKKLKESPYWNYDLQPWLILHYAGTLRRSIQKILANYLAENYSSYDDVDWEKLSQMEDFKGHSSLGLRRLVCRFRAHATLKYNLSPDNSKKCETLSKKHPTGTTIYSPGWYYTMLVLFGGV